MKKIFLTTLIGIAALTSCTNNNVQNGKERKVDFAELIDVPTTMSFDEMIFDFGRVVDGEVVTKIFTFENTGDEDLILLSVKGSCGCTIPEEWPTEPISPGDSGEIKVKFNSANRVGNIRKTVRIEANTLPTVTVLSITGVVETMIK